MYCTLPAITHYKEVAWDAKLSQRAPGVDDSFVKVVALQCRGQGPASPAGTRADEHGQGGGGSSNLCRSALCVCTMSALPCNTPCPALRCPSLPTVMARRAVGGKPGNRKVLRSALRRLDVSNTPLLASAARMKGRQLKKGQQLRAVLPTASQDAQSSLLLHGRGSCGGSGGLLTRDNARHLHAPNVPCRKPGTQGGKESQLRICITLCPGLAKTATGGS